MKKNLKTSSPLKLRIGRLATWELSPEFSHYTQNKIALILTNWLLALQEIPVNYLIFWSLQQQKKRSLRKSYLKYKFLYKNIHLSLKKKVFLYSCKKKKRERVLTLILQKQNFGVLLF